MTVACEGEALYRAALRCLPRPEPSPELVELIDAHRIRDPSVGYKTLDGRDAVKAWGAKWRESRDWRSLNITTGEQT